MTDIRIGTSGWSYKHWRGPFYPHDLNPKDQLAFYLRQFNSVEINNSFYNLPSQKAVREWFDSTPDDYLFAVKGSRYTTHVKRLRDPEAATGRLFEAIKALGHKTGPILFQLPPKWGAKPRRLRDFLQAMPEGYRYVFELRDPAWLVDDIYNVLREFNAALCFYDFAGFQNPEVATSEDLIYYRLHGPGGPYEGSYDDGVLWHYADRIKQWSRQGKDVFCYFDNDQFGFAPHNAAEVRKIVHG